MSRPRRDPKPSDKAASIFEGPAPKGYTELAIVDADNSLVMRVMVRADADRKYKVRGWVFGVLDSEVPPAPKLKVVR